ncbi:MAG: UMP kinase [Ascidiaceihabitans sp.]|uniref:UMP kinase n=1 Tax=Ascidiaceihabitans sp. TaxID=1872644 RepID=UPI003297024A
MRVLVKISGEALASGASGVFSDEAITQVVDQLLFLHSNNIDLAVVVGGGNIFRGSSSSDWNIERAEADNVGMLGTIVNGILLRAKFEAASNVPIRLMSAVDIPQIGEKYVRRRAKRHLEKRRIVILTGGIGEPYLTTDYPSVQRAVELGCETVLAVKNGIDAVYESDPAENPDARKFSSLTFEHAIKESLGFMDRAALVLAEQHDMKIRVLGFENQQAALEALKDGKIGTTVTRTGPISYH